MLASAPTMQQAEAIAAPRAKWLVAGAVAVLLGIVLRSAWVTEDAYITLRTVDNLVRGHGLRWNVGERVQGYTHPLWMLALSALYFVTREDFFTTLALGLGTTALALGMLTKLARSPGHALVAIVLLSLSRSFIDYSTSGLENPLSHLLLAGFVYLYAVKRSGLRVLALIAALAALNRSDAVIVLAPGLLHAGVVSLRTRGFRATAVDSVLGLSPYFAWEAFSLFYYGFLFPNTAYAKLNTGIPGVELASQGLTYFVNTFAWDTPGVVAMALGLALAVASRRLRETLVAVGVILYLLYVLRVGGDFMLGRFMTIPLFVAMCSLAIARHPLNEPTFAAGLLVPFVMLLLQRNAVEPYPAGDFTRSGVADERAVYRNHASLLHYTRGNPLPNHPWAEEGRRAAALNEQVSLAGNVGYRGFAAGPSLHIIDWNALTDPLLARLPMQNDPAWRVGHYKRYVPEGYVETVRANECLMADANLCAYYEKLQEVVAGDLLTWSRIKTIFAMLIGKHDHLIDEERYRYPARVRARASELSSAIHEGAPWNVPAARRFTADGIAIELDKLAHAKRIELMLDGNDRYEIEYRIGNETVASAEAETKGLGHLRKRVVSTPPAARERGYDSLVVRPVHGDGMYSVGYLRLR